MARGTSAGPAVSGIMKYLPREMQAATFFACFQNCPKKVPLCTQLQPQDGRLGPNSCDSSRSVSGICGGPPTPVLQGWPQKLSEDQASYEKRITLMELKL